MTGTRIAPDNNDVIVWKFDEAAAPFINSSTSTNALSHAISDLSTLSGTILLQQPSPFAASGANSCVYFTGTNGGSPRNYISGANNAEIQPPITVSCWLFLRTYNYTSYTQHFWSKQHTTGVWSGVYAQVGCQNRQYTSQPTSFDIFMATTGYVDIVLDSNGNIPINMWCHVGLTYDGVTKIAYINGNIAGTLAASGNINYGNHGPWFFGAIPAGSGSPEEGQYSICDFRVADIVRPQSYFQDIYRAGVTSSGSGLPFNVFYKMRAYDTSCASATPVYWVDTSISYTNAPSSPCGGPLGPIEVVETWPLLGVI